MIKATDRRAAVSRDPRDKSASVAARPIVLAAVRDHEWRRHIWSRLSSCSTLGFVDHVSELSAAAANRTPDVVLWHLGGELDGRETNVIAFRRLRHIAPRCCVIAYSQVDHSLAPHVLMAGEVGVDRVLIRGFDDLEQGIRDVVKAPDFEAMIRETVVALGLPSGPAAVTVGHCLRRNTTGRITVQQLAHDLDVNRKTIGVWLREAGLPAPEHLIGWCRVYWVSHLLSTSSLSVGGVARALHFASTSDLRRLVARYSGGTATALREPGSTARMLASIRTWQLTPIVRVDCAPDHDVTNAPHRSPTAPQ